jgi:hypothetical protein
MTKIITVLLLMVAHSGCSETHTPTTPTTPAQARPPLLPGAFTIRTEQWALTQSLEAVDGAGGCDPGLGAARAVDLGINYREGGAAFFYYDLGNYPTDHSADWTGTISGGEFFGRGAAYESLPCSSPPGNDGAPSELSGRFSSDGREFTAREVRSYTDFTGGAVVYFFTWRARYQTHWPTPTTVR